MPHSELLFSHYIRGFQNRFLSFLLSCTLFRCLPLLFAVFVSSFIRQSHKDVVFSTASSWNSVSSVYGERRDSSHISRHLRNGFRWVYIHNGLRNGFRWVYIYNGLRAALRSRARRRPFGRRRRVQQKKLKQEKREYNRLLAKCTPAKIGAELAAEIQAEFSYMVNESSSESESEAENPSDILPSPAGYNKLPDHDEDPPSTGITVVSRSLVCSR